MEEKENNNKIVNEPISQYEKKSRHEEKVIDKINAFLKKNSLPKRKIIPLKRRPR